MRQFNTPAGEVHALRFAADGRSVYLLSAELWITPDSIDSIPKHAYRCDIASGEVLDTWPFKASSIAIFAPDLRSIYHQPAIEPYSWEAAPDFQQFHLGVGRGQRVSNRSYSNSTCAAFAPNGRVLALGGDRVDRLDVLGSTELEPIPTPAVCLAYSPNGQLLATGTRDHVQVWDATKPIALWMQPAVLLSWLPDERLVWGSGDALSVAGPDETQARTWNVPHGHLSALAVSDCGRWIATGSERGQCSLRDSETGTIRGTFDWGIGAIHSVAFSPDGLTCAAGSENGQVVVWDVDV